MTDSMDAAPHSALSRRRPFGGKRKLTNVVDVRYGDVPYRRPVDVGALSVRPGELLVLEERGRHFVGKAETWSRRAVVAHDGARALRKATAADTANAESQAQKADELARYLVERIHARRVPMKLIRVEVDLKGERCRILFSAETRPDIRVLVRDLASRTRMGLDFRQVGVREGAGLIGGVGSCGQELCSSLFLRTFENVGIRHARAQGLPLHEQKTQGMCGRLKCCLVFEADTYKDLKKTVPRKGQYVLTEAGYGVILSADPLTRKARVRYEERSDESVPLRSLVLLAGPPTDAERRALRTREEEVIERRKQRRGGAPEVRTGKSREANAVLQEEYLWSGTEGSAEIVESADAAAPGAPGAGATARRGRPGRRGASGLRPAPAAGAAPSPRQGPSPAAKQHPDAAPSGEGAKKRRRRRAKGTGGPAAGASPPPEGGASSAGPPMGGGGGEPKPSGAPGSQPSGQRRRRRSRGSKGPGPSSGSSSGGEGGA